LNLGNLQQKQPQEIYYIGTSEAFDVKLRNNYIPIRKEPYHDNLLWRWNSMTYRALLEGRAQYICLHFQWKVIHFDDRRAKLNTEDQQNAQDWKADFRVNNGIGVYFSDDQNVICVSNVHFMIFPRMFPVSFLTTLRLFYHNDDKGNVVDGIEDESGRIKKVNEKNVNSKMRTDGIHWNEIEELELLKYWLREVYRASDHYYGNPVISTVKSLETMISSIFPLQKENLRKHQDQKWLMEFIKETVQMEIKNGIHAVEKFRKYH